MSAQDDLRARLHRRLDRWLDRAAPFVELREEQRGEIADAIIGFERGGAS